MRLESIARLFRVLVAAALVVVVAGPLPAEEGDEAPAAPTTAGFDPLPVRRRLLRGWDAEIDAEATRAHLAARRLLDQVMPLPYLGIDADPDGGGMRVTKVLAATAASEAGLLPGDVILSFAGTPTPSAAALGGAVRGSRVGARYVLRIRRGEAESDLPVTIGRRPEEDEDEDEGEVFGPLDALSPAEPRVVDFQGDAVASAPQGWELLLGGHGSPPRFVVREDDAGRWLRQDDADPTGLRYPMAILEGWRSSDVVARVRFRHAGGVLDRAAGVVVRWKDPGNYLVARVNGVEGDLRIFRVANGLRKTLPEARAKAATDDERWHVLEVRAEGPRISATLDDGVSVSSYDTFIDGGGVGVWTKSDSRTDFDDFSVRRAER